MKKKIRNISLIIWLSTLVFFVVLLFGLNQVSDQQPLYSQLAYIWLADIGIGIVSFLVLIFASTNTGNKLAKGKKNSNLLYRPVSLGKAIIVIGLILFGLFGSGIIVQDYLSTKEELNNLKNQVQPVNSPSPTSIVNQQKTNTNYNNIPSNPLINCVGPDKKSFKTTQAECDKFNAAWGITPIPDPNQIIKCNIHANCGGGYKEMTRSSCDQIICCEKDFNHTWQLTSKSECNSAQKTNENNSWTEFCNSLCSAYNPDMCQNYWQPGTTGMSSCISDQYSQKSTCLTK
jgi:uncharacterized membrane protein